MSKKDFAKVVDYIPAEKTVEKMEGVLMRKGHDGKLIWMTPTKQALDYGDRCFESGFGAGHFMGFVVGAATGAAVTWVGGKIKKLLSKEDNKKK